MPTIGSQQYFQEQEEEERRRREEQERLAAQAASQAAAQQQQANIQTQQQELVEQDNAAPGAPIVPENQNGAPAAASTPAQQTDAASGTDNGDSVEVDNTVSTAMAQQNAATEQAMQDAIDAGNTNNQNYQNFIANLVQGYQNDLAEAKKEAELQKQIDTNKSVFAGVTEFVSGLANLIGTTQGAVNQQPRTYAQDWMREADQHRQQERDRLDRMRDRLRQQEMTGENTRYQMTKEQIAEQLKLRQLKSANAIGFAQQQKRENDEAYERDYAERAQADKNTQFAQTLALNVLKENNRHQEQMAKAGVTGVQRKGNGDYTVTYKKDYSSGSGSRSGSGTNKDNVLTIPKVGDMPETRYHVPLDMVHQLVYDYIKAGSVEDLDEQGQKIFDDLNKAGSLQMYGSSPEKVSETSEKLRPLIAHSPTLREAVRLLEEELRNQRQQDNDETDDDEFPSVDDDGFPNP